ncbi:MAG: flotillin-like FloA family protein, partial [Sedimentisphaerales bacterium]
IIARVGQGIVSAIGSAGTYKDVLEHPDRISRKVLESGLDAQTAFEIVSIDIADVSVAGVSTKDKEVSNVGAMLETERAEADKRMRQAEAEGRRAMAVAREQEMRALVVENEAKVPLAMAEAFIKGNLGIMDYYRMKNISADTSMRDSISKVDKK